MDPVALLAHIEAGGSAILAHKAQNQQLAAENQELKERIQSLEALIGKLNAERATGAAGS